ncbi:MAG: 4Fe-4S dicluster domain-containing protein [Saprospiraceae bacterium]
MDTTLKTFKYQFIKFFQWISWIVICFGVLILILATFDKLPILAFPFGNNWLIISLGSLSIGILLYSLLIYLTRPSGIQNNHIWIQGISARKATAWIVSLILTFFYCILYWWPEYLGHSDAGENTGLIAFFDPLSMYLKNKPASQWFVYGALYTLAILLFGIKFILKYRHNRYQVIRTISVMFFQTGIAFLLPEYLLKMNLPYNDYKNMWPLNYYFFDGWHIQELLSHGNIGRNMLLFGILMIVFISPVLTYFYGKRWYCSWVCGCGGLAETAGDSFRHLSDKSIKSWKLERILVYAVLLFSIIMTAGVIYTFQTGQTHVLGISSAALRSWYGFIIGAVFSGVIGVGFYPLLGSRVWCRFGCPMAAILGIQQRFFSRFRITTNGSQCISCGNCTTYCEMGIDVRSYAQRGANIVRASCVGCGICAAVCPRGVLRLENGSVDLFSRTEKPKPNPQITDSIPYEELM